MRTSDRPSSAQFAHALIESLESRQLLSVATPVAAVGPIAPASATSVASTILSGVSIHAVAGQAFRAVVGNVGGALALPAAYTLKGTINWGDGSAPSVATFIPQSNGSIAVLGSHAYAAAGNDSITVSVMAAPPAGSMAPVLLIGTILSKANVINPNGGVTLSEPARTPFTATVGTFHSTRPASTMSAVITWGDGTQSIGKIVALPTAGILPTFAVVGTHAYATAGSYAVHVVIYAPDTVAGTTSTNPPTVLVAQFDSVVDVLPLAATPL